MSTVKLYFNAPLPNNQQHKCVKNLREMGFKPERIFQNGKYIKWCFRGRLPTFENENNVICQIVDDSIKSDLTFHKIDFVEFTLYFERKNKNDY